MAITFIPPAGFSADQSLNTSSSVTFNSVTLPNYTQVLVGSFDNSTGGANGISLLCAVGYELNWQGGRLRSIMQGDESATPQAIYCDSALQWQGESGNLTVEATGITFPDDSVQASAFTSVQADELAAIVAALVPPAIDDLAGAAGDTEATLTWTAPTVLDQTPITDYEVEYSDDDGDTWTPFADGESDTPGAVVDELTNDTEYLFRVRAVNAIGAGEWAVSDGVTPSATPPGVAELLLHFDTDFSDSSGNDYVVTADGTADISSAESKFGGASLRCDGDGLTVADSASLIPATGDFTLEAWIWVDSEPPYTYPAVFGANGSIIFGPISGLATISVEHGGVGGLGFAGTLSGLDEWVHVALTREGNTFRLFSNGALVGTNTYSGTFSPSADYKVGDISGDHRSSYLYIDELRITHSCLYTGTFTPPTAPYADPPVVPSLLLHFDGGNGSTSFTDSSPSGLTVTANGGVEISTAHSQFGGASGSFNGSDAYLTFGSADLSLGDGDFTVEMWVYPTATQTAFLADWRGAGGNSPTLYLQSGELKWFDGVGVDTATGETLANNQWQHVAVCRSGSTVRLFIDGVQAGSNITQTNDYEGSGGLRIGYHDNIYFAGYIDELRIVRGEGSAFYTENFTPPAAPFA